MEFIKEIIFLIFSCPSVTVETHFQHEADVFVGRTFVGHLSQFDGFLQRAARSRVEEIFKCFDTLTIKELNLTAEQRTGTIAARERTQKTRTENMKVVK